MDTLQRNINALEREIQISHANPWKVIVGTLVVVSLVSIIMIWWVQPTSLKEHGKMSYPKIAQFLLALSIGTVSLLWIFWNLFMY